jgi:hypothetical protein
LDDRQILAETQAYDRWISLDFLGFSRPNLDLSMGYGGFSLEVFSSRFFPQRSQRGQRLTILEGEGAGLFIAQAYLNF